MNNTVKDFKDDFKEYLDKLFRERAREMLAELLKIWGIPVVFGQLVSLLRGMKDKEVLEFAKDVEIALSKYEERIKK